MIRFNERLQRAREEDGFTLIELMVVVLIIAILIAIAIPTFLGARKRAQDRAAQSSIRNAVTAAKAVFTDNENYVEATVSSLTESEPSLTFVAAGDESIDSTTVSIGSETVLTATKHTRFVAAALSDTGICWYAQDVAGPSGVGAFGGTKWARDDDAADCNANLGLAENYDDAAVWFKKPPSSSDDDMN